jgi:cytochrome c oxidase subunit 4
MAEHEEHVVSPVIYVAVLVTLMLLLALTLIAAFVDLDKLLAGENHSGTAYWNMAAAILIAICKALLIILFFMHVKYGSRLTWAFAAAGFVWLGIMMTLSLSDYFTRNYPAGSPKSPPNYPSPTYERPQPRHDSVVPGASAAPLWRQVAPDTRLLPCDECA